MSRPLPIDLATTPELRSFRDDLRRWLDANLTDEWRVGGLWDPTGAAGDAFDRRRSWQRRLYDGGWTGVHWPKEHGGRGASLLEHAIWLIETSQAGAPEQVGAIGLNMVGPTLIQHGTSLQQRHLDRILSAEEIWCQLFSEPDAGSDLGNVQTRATQRGDGRWVATGQKVWTSWGEHADHGLLLARTSGSRFAGMSCFIVDMQETGVTTRPIQQMSGEAHFSEVFLDEVVLPEAALVGPLDQGWAVATSTLVHERTTAILSRHAATAAAAEQLVAVGGAGPWRDEVVRLWIEAQVLRLNGCRGVIEAAVGDGVPTVSYTQRLHWGLVHRAILDAGLTACGAAGAAYVPELEPEWTRLASASRGWTIGGGTSEIQRTMLADKVLGLPRA